MTTQVTVSPAGHRVNVTTTDLLQEGTRSTDEVLEPGDAARIYYATTTRSITVVDLENDSA